MLNKTLKVAAGFCLMATTAFAQMPQLTELPVQKIAPAKLSLEQMKGNFEAVKMQRPAMRMNKVNLSDRVMKPMTGIIPGVKQVMTRAGAFGAYYEVPAGIYNIKSGFEYMEGVYSRHGILAPIYQDVVFKDASTGAANIDWYVNSTLVVNEDSISVAYIPGGDTFYSPMPELTAYTTTGQDSIYQYGYALDYETGQYTEGQAVNIGFGYVHNLDAGAESFYHTYMNTMNGYWTQMLFGYNEVNNAEYFEIFEKPYHPVVLNSMFTYVATPVGHSIADVEFSMYVMEFDEAKQGWKMATEKVSAKPAGKLGSMEECDVWSLEIYFEKPLLIDEQFALVLGGPQDGSAYWAFMYQDNRDFYSGKVTAGYIPQTGDYAGYLTPYAIQPDGATEPIAYPASIDLGLQIFMPYNMAVDPVTYEYVNYGGYTEIGAEGLNAPTLLWNWEAYIMGSKSSMKITSNADWLRAEITRNASDDYFLSDVTIYADPLPADVAGRKGVLTFTDGQGYQSTWTFVQGDPAAGIGQITTGQPTLDLNAPIFDLTGRQVSNPAKGIYLQNGKKFVVK